MLSNTLKQLNILLVVLCVKFFVWLRENKVQDWTEAVQAYTHTFVGLPLLVCHGCI